MLRGSGPPSSFSLIPTLGTYPLKSSKVPFPWDMDFHLTQGSLGPRESARKRHLDRFSRLCTAYPRAQHMHTDTQTTLRATYVTTGRIYALHAGDATYIKSRATRHVRLTIASCATKS